MMGKQNEKNKKRAAGQGVDSNGKQNSRKAYDKDTAVFISMSQELKEEGNRLFQKRDHEGAMMKYEKAIKLLPRNHIDVSHLRSNMAACYMQMGVNEYPRAIHECDLALQVTPKYSKALLKRARCYEALNRLDLALNDVSTVLKMEPNNIMATEVAERVNIALERRGLRVNGTVIELPAEYVEPPSTSSLPTALKEKKPKKENKKVEEKAAKDESEAKKAEKAANDEIKEKKAKDESEAKTGEKAAKDEIEEKMVDKKIEEKETEDKVVAEEQSSGAKEESKKTVKLVFGQDIRCTQVPLNCSLLQLREVISDRFLGIGAFLIKYRDQEGDLVTITTDEELRWAEASAESMASIKLYLVKVNPQQDPFYWKLNNEKLHKIDLQQKLVNGNMDKGEEAENGSCHIDEWIVEFAKLFKDHVGFDSDAYLSLHELGVKVYSEAMEEAITSEEAQDLFNTAAGTFQEMAALALFNWGNVHMSRARKKVYFTEDASKESILERIKSAYDWAQKEYVEAGQKYEAALRIKPDFYEALLALGHQQFEQAKLAWYYTVGNNVELEPWPPEEIVQLYNSAEDNMEKGMQMWEEQEAQRRNQQSISLKNESHSEKTGLDGLFKDISAEAAAEQAKTMRSQINLLWGTILYERSIMEFKLGLPVWQDCLEIAVEKFELAGASPTDIAVMIKNHISNSSALEGLGFRIDEIVQAWNEMYEAKKWHSRVPSFRLEPILRRRVPKLYHALELA